LCLGRFIFLCWVLNVTAAVEVSRGRICYVSHNFFRTAFLNFETIPRQFYSEIRYFFQPSMFFPSLFMLLESTHFKPPDSSKNKSLKMDLACSSCGPFSCILLYVTHGQSHAKQLASNSRQQIYTKPPKVIY
jgi:hypothetical protein